MAVARGVSARSALRASRVRVSRRPGRAAPVAPKALGLFGNGDGGEPAAEPAVVVAKAPPGVVPPPIEPDLPQPFFGFVKNAEILNSRAAMIGFFSLLFVEAIAGKGLLELVGIEVGNGIDIGF